MSANTRRKYEQSVKRGQTPFWRSMSTRVLQVAVALIYTVAVLLCLAGLHLSPGAGSPERLLSAAVILMYAGSSLYVWSEKRQRDAEARLPLRVRLESASTVYDRCGSISVRLTAVNPASRDNLIDGAGFTLRTADKSWDSHSVLPVGVAGEMRPWQETQDVPARRPVSWFLQVSFHNEDFVGQEQATLVFRGTDLAGRPLQAESHPFTIIGREINKSRQEQSHEEPRKRGQKGPGNGYGGPRRFT